MPRQPRPRVRQLRLRRLRAALSLTAALLAVASAVTLAVLLPGGQDGPGDQGSASGQTGAGAASLAVTTTRYKPVDPKASAAAARELNYLGNLPVSRQFLTGFWAGWSNVQGGFTGYQDMADLFNATGRYPGLVACDYNGFARPRSATYVAESDCDGYLVGYHKQGGVTEVGFHPNNPTGGKYGAGLTKTQVTALLKRGTTTYVNWHNQLNQVAAGLNLLGSRGVTVIFRPLVEMNQSGGSWFWWNGGGWTAARYVAVWRDMFKSVTAKLKHHNVLWDWSPDQDGNTGPAAYYPGAAYVDITGLDVYARKARRYPVAPVTDYKSVLKPGKPFGFNEVGKNEGLAHDFSAWPAKIRSTYTRASFFLSWNSIYGPLTKGSSGARKMMNAPGDVNLGYPLLVAGFEGGSTDDWAGSTSQPQAMNGPWSTSKTDGADWAAQGASALKADIKHLGQGQQVILRDAVGLDLTGRKKLTAVVNVASWNAPATGMTARLYLRTGAAGTYHPGPAVPVSYTAKGTALSLSLPGIAGLGNVTKIGVTFTSAKGAATGSVYLDDVVVS